MRETKFAFLFAPHHHPATKRVVPIRKQLGFRTIFNFLGPLSNPLGASYQVLGVSSKEMLPIIAEVLSRLGTKRAMIVRGEDGLDEITLAAETQVFEINDGTVKDYTISPEDFGLQRVTFSEIAGNEPAVSAALTRELLDGVQSAYRDLVCINAAAALVVSGHANELKSGLALAYQAIDSGEAKKVLEGVIEISNAN